MTFTMPQQYASLSQVGGLAGGAQRPRPMPGSPFHRMMAGTRGNAGPSTMGRMMPGFTPLHGGHGGHGGQGGRSDMVPHGPLPGTTAMTPGPVAPAPPPLPWATPAAPTFDPNAKWQDADYQERVLDIYHQAMLGTAGAQAELERLTSEAGKQQYQRLFDETSTQQQHQQYAANADFARAGIAQGGALETQARLSAPGYAQELAKLNLEHGWNVGDAGSRAYQLAQGVQHTWADEQSQLADAARLAQLRGQERTAQATKAQQDAAAQAATSQQAALLEAAGLAVPPPVVDGGAAATAPTTTMPQAPGVQQYAPKGWVAGQSGWFKTSKGWNFIGTNGAIQIGVSAPPTNLGGHKVWQ